MTSGGKPSKTPVEDGGINPHKCGDYMMVHKEPWENFVLSLDFKISKKCNSGVFVRTSRSRRGRARTSASTAWRSPSTTRRAPGYHDTGAIYDLVKPTKNAMKPAGEWNHIVITCDKNRIDGRAERRDR